MRQEYLRAAAEAYANLNDHQSDCYHYLNDGFDTTIQARLASTYEAALIKRYGSSKYICKVVSTALSECQYPFDILKGCAWGSNERAAFAGIPKATWSRNNLSDYVNFILDDINANSRRTRSAILRQVNGYEMDS